MVQGSRAEQAARTHPHAHQWGWDTQYVSPSGETNISPSQIAPGKREELKWLTDCLKDGLWLHRGNFFSFTFWTWDTNANALKLELV